MKEIVSLSAADALGRDNLLSLGIEGIKPSLPLSLATFLKPSGCESSMVAARCPPMDFPGSLPDSIGSHARNMEPAVCTFPDS